ncbi:MAG: hypothetical protein ABIF12_03625 [bacterium]
MFCFLKFRFLSILFLLLIFVNAYGEQVIDSDISLDGFTSQLNDLNSNLNLKNLEAGTQLFGDLRGLKEDLVLQKIKLETFEDLFLNMCRLFKKIDISKEEKTIELLKIAQDLNNLFNTINSDYVLEEDLKNKIYLLSDLMNLFINNNGIDSVKLDKNLISISQSIDIIDQVLDSNESEDKDNISLKADQNPQDLSFNTIKTSKIEKIDLSVDDEDKVITSNINIREKDLDLDDQKDLSLQEKNSRKSKRIIDINLNDLKKVGRSAINLLRGVGDYRVGGYPMQFMHQLVQHMDKVYNR